VVSVQHRTVAVDGADLAFVEAGDPSAPALVLLHGWPEDHSAWAAVMRLAEARFRCIAFDLPGIGRSTVTRTDGEKAHLAALLHAGLQALGIGRCSLVGQDAGGMTAFAWLRAFDDVDRAVIMDTAIPGVEPWDAVLANPHVWHFGFHAVPGLPELLVAHEPRAYFDFFFDAITAHPEALADEDRDRYAAAYARPEALRQGFELYRAFRADAAANARRVDVEVPLLYLRGDAEGGDLDVYLHGLRGAGFRDVRGGRIADAGHFAPEENPDGVWAALEAFL
jgi:pimeloyl-ACP methyl ester carboxylesterase